MNLKAFDFRIGYLSVMIFTFHILLTKVNQNHSELNVDYYFFPDLQLNLALHALGKVIS